MQARHPRQTRIQRQQQVEALLGTDLTDNDARGPHPQALLDELAQRHLTGALEPPLPRLHGDPVGMPEATIGLCRTYRSALRSTYACLKTRRVRGSALNARSANAA